MNRTQRRHSMRQDKRRNRMLEQQQNIPMQIRHGHNGKQVVMQFTRPTTDLCMSPEQARALIGGVEGALKMLESHIANQQQPASPPPPAMAANEASSEPAARG